MEDNKIKILFILHTSPPIHGSSVVGDYIKNSRLINENFVCRFVNLGISSSVEEIGKNPTGKVIRYLRLICQVKKELLSFRPDLSYITISSKGSGFYKDAILVLIVRLFGARRVYHFHNKGVSLRQNWFFDNLLYRIVFKNSKVILLSRHLYYDVQKYVPFDKVYYAANGIPDIVSARPKNIKTSPASITNILFLSHLIESKGVFVLVEALKIVKERGLIFHCRMIGGEGDVSVEQMKNSIEMAGLDGYLEVVGRKYGEEKYLAFEKSDILVLPTYNDCMPLVLIEAMQHSLPIISTPEGAIPDVVVDGVNGFLVPQRDANALADKIEVLLKDTALRIKMGSAGRSMYESQFTIECFERRMADILTHVAEV